MGSTDAESSLDAHIEQQLLGVDRRSRQQQQQPVFDAGLLQALAQTNTSNDTVTQEAAAVESDEHGSSIFLWDSVWEQAAVYASQADEVDGVEDGILARIQTAVGHTANAQSILKSIQNVLTSNASDDAASEQLVDLLGFDHLDLVSDIISQRSTLIAQIQQAQSSSSTASTTHITEAAPTPATRSDTYLSAVPDAWASAQLGLKSGGGKPYTPASQVIIHTAGEQAEAKRLRAEQRRLNRHRHGQANAHDENDLSKYSAADLERIRDEQLLANASRPLISSDRGPTSTSQPEYPHVFSSATNSGHGNIISIGGSKFALPIGTTREQHTFYEEVKIPPPRQVPFRMEERLIPIHDMEPLCRPAFPGYTSLNRLQSAVYPLGYGTSENLLVCAPTGAGKTDVAMLTVLRTISQYSRPKTQGKAQQFDIARNAFKIVYVAPMKALAAEVVRKFSKRLAYLGIKVREFTGDMQLTRQEIAETQMIVTTPEKWDVATRKPTGEGELATKVKLLIIDEVHLLHEERGAVIETIVARTLRLVESSQSLIRIVGLSATLPNYVDVADFLRVNRYQGLFYFDSSFRPVPLEQHFIGVKGKAGSPTSRSNLDKAAFEKASELIQDGHQVMVFVHARKETVKAAQALREAFQAEGLSDLLTTGKTDHPSKYEALRRDVSASRNREMKELFEQGFGIHHAGMLRADRNISERAFEQGITKVLCCTATLAWGVNLPAFAVLIKGTDVYDSGVGKFVDLSILDVLQIFGRAGRPQYEDLGVGYILTANDKLDHYVDAITAQHPIESKFEVGLTDSLNAEVALGTVTSVRDGISWLGYTYLFTRMRRQPLAYGMTVAEVMDDPHLGAKRVSLVQNAVKRLEAAKMIVSQTGAAGTGSAELMITDLGRIAARYYIPCRTMEVFNEKLRARMSEADVLHVLSMATDFEQIIMRDSEEQELKKLLEKAPCDVPGGIDTAQGKVNILLQSFISREYVEDFALVSDSAYVAQNAGRIIRALLEIALAKNMAPASSALISMSKAIEKRLWPFEHPLAQSGLPQETLYNLTRWADEVEVQAIRSMSAAEIGKLIHLNERLGGFVRTAAKQFPQLQLSYALRPLSHTILRIDVNIERDFDWSEKAHGGAESFYVWVQDEAGDEILQSIHAVIRPQTKNLDLAFHVPLGGTGTEGQQLPNGVTIRWISDRWLSSEESIWVSFQHLHMPAPPPVSRGVLDLPLLLVRDSVQNEAVQQLYSNDHGSDDGEDARIVAWNALQTQMFHAVVHTKANILVTAPVVSGKTTLLEMAIWRALNDPDESRSGPVLHISPNQHVARKSFEAFVNRGSALAGAKPRLALTGKGFSDHVDQSVLFTTPRTLLRVSQHHPSALASFSLIIAEDLHLLDAPYELAVTSLRQKLSEQRVRWAATAVSLQDATAVGSWFNIKPEYQFCFEPKDRPSPLTLSLHSLDIMHSLALIKAMIKPAYDKIKQVAAREPTIIFVPSRTQCANTAQDMITRLASELDTEAFLGVTPPTIEGYIQALQDRSLSEALFHGIGIFHEGINAQDRALTIELFRSGVIRVLIVPREVCWSLPVRAKLVIIMGTQYVRLQPVAASENTKTAVPVYDRKTVDYPMTDLVRMQGYAVRRGTPEVPDPAGECLILCQASHRSLLQQVLNAGLPLTSELISSEQGEASLIDELAHLVGQNLIKASRDAVDFLSWTFLFYDMQRNPTFYDAHAAEAEATSDRLSDLVDSLLGRLSECDCVSVQQQTDADGDAKVKGLTSLGRALLAHHRPGLVGRCADLFNQVRGQPILAAQRVSASLESGAEDDESLLGSHLDALRLRVPGDYLAAFDVPRPSRSARKADRKGPKKDGANGRGGAPSEATSGQAGTAGPSTDAGAEASTSQAQEASEPATDPASLLQRQHVPRLLLAAFFSGQHPQASNAGAALRKRRDALLVQLLQSL
ncbi:putative steryl acetyl hydrolase mug81 [Tilletia horrida]|uniref:Steryl acetyl hydrolase mug81 n=1 Tax=Tilletia horrida TaxID=155126 RepID=A0AAN6GK95_9BASI|nr:putative steryl acetyl hydrolase mug81 [Tilletia horrida]